MTRRTSSTLIFLLLAALPAAAGAAGTPEPVGDEFQVNSYTSGTQDFPAVAADAEGNFVVVWESVASGGSDSSAWSIQGQRFDAAGATIGEQFQVNTYTTSFQGYPQVAVDADGDFVVVWHSSGSSGSDSSQLSVHGQRFDAGGATVGVEFQVNTYTTESQGSAAVAADGDGNFVVVWTSLGSSGSDSSAWSIQGQRFDAAGAPVGAEFQVNTYTNDTQGLPAVVADADGDFVVVWVSDGSSGSDSSSWSIQGQRFDAAGATVGGQFQVNTYTTGSQYRPSVVADTDGDFVVVWQSDGSSGSDSSSWSVQGRRFDAAGATVGDQFQVNTYTTSAQSGPSVVADADGDFVVMWHSDGSSGSDSSSWSVQGQRFDAAGATAGVEFQVNTYTTGLQAVVRVAETGDDFVVVWQSYGSSGSDSSGYCIQGQRFGFPIFTDGFESGDTTAWSSSVP